ncbi:MAG: formylglycine-generating enzyme family protein [Candidatus Hydrogenedentes bacterium]|nr:formylglycine-generating enzyme family protein [Candidatus Hydrogenedentota bacterium]
MSNKMIAVLLTIVIAVLALPLIARFAGGKISTETIMLPGDVPLEMVRIEPGTFQMGRYSGEKDSWPDEHPQHQVTLTSGFWMAKYELTKAQWTAVMGTTPWSGLNYVLDNPDSPAVYVSWHDAQAFITAVNSYTSKTFRLPTEAEWEYACRAWTTTRFYWGDDPGYTAIDDYAWWEGNADYVGQDYAHVVGQKLPNAFGLYDMSGNVWEWRQDWYDSDYYSSSPETDPEGPASGSRRVLRGGGWADNGNYCRSAYRPDASPSYTRFDIGFRLSR